MSITTEEAERHARLLGIFPAPAAAIRSLAAERDVLKAENDKLRAALKECADDLEAEITHRYGDMVPKYPRERLKRDQDMAPVMKARAALGEKQ
jgi:hypothetical protein